VSDYLGLRASAIYVVDEGIGAYRYITSLGAPAKIKDLIRKDIPIDKSSVIGIAATQKQIITPSALQKFPELARQVAGLTMGNVKQMIYVPFVARGKVWAVLGGKLGRGFSLTRPIQQTLEAIGAQVAVGIENARRYETEKNIADTLQSALLEMPHKIEGIKFGSLYRSATEAAKVGGDFYELFELDRNRIGVIIGDVSGKGIEAATLTSLVKNTIKAYAFEDASPAVVIAKTNEIIRRASPDSSFVTVFFGTLDTKTRELVYCSGGHLPGLIKRTGSGVEVLCTNSPIVGAFADMAYCHDKIILEYDDTLVLYTDGVTEARFEGHCFEEERLISILNELTPTPVEEIPKVIFEQLETYTDGNLSDDVVLLAVVLDNQD
jgi:serine phosphatase RsbU (regulator of sigma subunit)